jgi:hypothetical protein
LAAISLLQPMRTEQPNERRQHDPSRTRWLAAASLIALCHCGAATGDEWREVAPVSVVEVRIHWTTPRELEDIARSVGWRSEPLAGQRTAPKAQGFSILARDKDTGAYACDIFMVPAPQGRFTSALFQTLGHEMVHCLGQEHAE